MAENPADTAIRLDGVNDAGTATAAVDTRQAFTVTAWARLSGKTHDAVVVSQSGTQGSGFSLQYSAASDRWVFLRHRTDTASSAVVQASSAVAPTTGKWTHLAGVFEPNSGALTLYVNGEAQQTVTFSDRRWNAVGALRVGQSLTGGVAGGFFAGDIDDVRVFAGTLDAAALYRFAQ